MCGIATILLHPQTRSEETWQEIKEALTQNLLYNQTRGQSATGLALVQADGKVILLKMSLPAHQFVAQPEYHTLLDQVNEQTTLLLGHTRHPTKGEVSDINNHPLQTGSVYGVHNGHIKNDDELFARWQLPRQGQVDSEIIFRLLEPYSPFGLNSQYLALVRPKLQYLQGKFTFLACDRRNPNKLLVVKHENPLSIHYHAPWNTLIFSSRYIFLRKFFGRAVITETLPNDQLMLFEADTLLKKLHHPASTLPLYLYDGEISSGA